MFGRRNAGGGTKPPSGPPPQGEAPRLPWEPEHYLAGNLAIGNVRENLLARLSEEGGRVNAQILMITAGALAGFAAQHAALVEADRRRSLGRKLGPQDLVLAQTQVSERYVLGDMVNHFLLEQAGVPPVPVMQRAAVQAGASEQRLPELRAFMSHVAKTMGTPAFGVIVGMGDHAPQGSVAAFLRLWPWMAEILALEPPGLPRPALPEAHWPAVIGLAATQFLDMVKGTVRPEVAAALYIQAALICAKVDPELAEPGVWSLTTGGGLLEVRRLQG